MARFGRQSDLARELNISQSAVSQAFKKYGLQFAIDGKFDLDYAIWQLREKQNQTRCKAQRASIKQLPGIRNPRVRREVIRLLWPIWDETIVTTIKEQAERGFENDKELDDLESLVFYLMNFWEIFHRIVEREYPADLGDFKFKKPDSINYDYFRIDTIDHIKKILSMNFADNPGHAVDTDYSKMPLEELEALVLQQPDSMEDEVGNLEQQDESGEPDQSSVSVEFVL